MPRVLPRYLIVAGFYVLLAGIALYWPLAQGGTHLPGSPDQTDYFHFHWSYWWIGHALSTPGLDVFSTAYVMAPFTTNLAYHTMSPVWYPLWALLEPPFGTVAAMNGVVLVALTLTGTSLYALLRTQHTPHGLALLGGAVFMLAPPMLLAVYMSTIHYLGFFWLPVLLLLWRQVATNGGTRRAIWTVLMGLALYLTLMTDYQYFLYGALIVVPYGLLTLLQAEEWGARIHLISVGVMALVLMLLLGWIAGPLPALLEFDRDTLARVPAEDVYSVPFLDGLVSRYTYADNTIAAGTLLVPLLVISVIWRLVYARAHHAVNLQTPFGSPGFWLVITVVLLVLALGSQAPINGTTTTLPYGWIHEPLGGLFRSPGRFAMAAFVPGILFIAAVWSPVWRQTAVKWRSAAGIVLLLFIAMEARIYTPFPIQPQPPAYDFYAQMGDEDLDYVVIEAPTAAGTGETWVGHIQDLALQFYGMTHEKRMVNGLIARAPISHFWYLRTESPALSWLGQRVALTPQAEDDLRNMIASYPVGYVVVHQDHIGLETNTNQEVIGYLNGRHDLLCPAYVEGGAVAYRTAWHPADCEPRTPPEVAPGVYQVNVGSLEDAPYLGWGWHWREAVGGLEVRWTGDWSDLVFGIEAWLPGSRPQAQVFADLPPGDYTLEITVQGLERTRSLELQANGRTLGTADVSPDGLSTLRFDLPAGAINPVDVDTFTLIYDGADAPGGNSDPTARRLALMVESIRFVRAGAR